VEDSERDRLIKVLRMFGSTHDGEVASAARRAHEIVKKHSLDWDDLVLPVKQHQQQQQQYDNDGFADVEDEYNEAFLIRRAQQFSQFLSDYEQKFLPSIADSLIEWGRLTPKQRAVLDRINNKLKLRGCW
jgi:TorA maturation chaperone TorD